MDLIEMPRYYSLATGEPVAVPAVDVLNLPVSEQVGDILVTSSRTVRLGDADWQEALKRWMYIAYGAVVGEDTAGRKVESHWVTIDDRPVFIGRPGQGAGISGPQETGRWGLSGDEAKLKDTRIASLCARGKMTRSQTANTKALLQGVPLSDLDDLAYIKVAREGDPELKQRGLTVNERGYIALPLDPGYGSREQVGFYDYVNKIIVMAPAEIYGAGNFLIHELGHHVLNNNDTAMRVSSVVVGKINAQIHALESSDQPSDLQAYYDGFGQAGLRKYSMTNPREFLADAYMIWRLSGEDTKQKLVEIWQNLGSSSPHYKPLDMLIAEHAAEKAWGRKEAGRFVILGEGDARRAAAGKETDRHTPREGNTKEEGRWVTIDERPVLIGGPGQGAGSARGSGGHARLDRLTEMWRSIPSEIRNMVPVPDIEIREGAQPQFRFARIILDPSFYPGERGVAVFQHEYGHYLDYERKLSDDECFVDAFEAAKKRAPDIPDPKYTGAGNFWKNYGTEEIGMTLNALTGGERGMLFGHGADYFASMKNADRKEVFAVAFGAWCHYNANYFKVFPELERAMQQFFESGTKEEARWVTIDEQPVLIGGAPQGAGVPRPFRAGWVPSEQVGRGVPLDPRVIALLNRDPEAKEPQWHGRGNDEPIVRAVDEDREQLLVEATGLEDEAGYDGLINATMLAWASTSSDQSPESLIMQQQAAELFGEPVNDYLGNQIETYTESAQIESLNDFVDKWDRHFYDGNREPEAQRRLGDWVEQRKTILQAMYDTTQQRLRDAGFGPEDTITLYRGVKLPKYDYEFYNTGEQMLVHGNPLESWTVDAAMAGEFMRNVSRSQVGYLLAMEVPVERIFSTAFTGLGCWEEGEMVLLGGKDSLALVVENWWED